MGGRNFLNQSFYTNFWYPGIESILRWTPLGPTTTWVQIFLNTSNVVKEYPMTNNGQERRWH